MTLSAEDMLDRLYSTREAVDEGGAVRPLHSEIPRSFADALTVMIQRVRPQLVVEIGMAHGLSSLAILRALPDGGELISVDPFQTDKFGGAGRCAVAETDRANAHRLIEEPSHLALPALLREGMQVDFVYIDGMHTFDYVALDAFYAHKLLPVGGVVGFNDCGYRSVHKFLKYFRRHRDYQELDSGLPADHRGANPAFTAVRRLTGRSNQDRYFRKLSDREPRFDEFHQF